MIRSFGWTGRIAAGLVAVVLFQGCGGSSPEPETDIADTGYEAPVETPVDDTPPPRDETPVWVDPNQTHAALLVPINFEFNKYRIREADKAKLEGIAGLMKANSNFRLLVEGHCDERGTNEYNMGLGEQRALSTKRYLVALGVPESRFTTISYGEERPLDSGSNEAAWARNRRAQFRIEAPRS
ncbi:MAG: OmpA family protein [Gemmatimonadetes bacterium]|nr:OmpA family protein [Gemmatimonadota bacterium]